ncbi:polysaccharide deacetylase family protein [uncultured Microbacterium sp.]|uniref:polysaccharide deacetylase family protein n=1 Tax=uncultured Microbacterium sp. TaxID=191216 RepID=UPI002628D996|nr:polysaccharide deacetylase family protein [uncultured Microbacterium sp.]
MNEREPGEAQYWMPQSEFLRVLDVVAGSDGVELSFDDGNRTDVDVALPALRERNLRATFFPLAGRLDDPMSLGRDDLHELRAHGMTIGSHGWDHVPWRRLGPDAVRREFDEARTVLADVAGAPIDLIAAPLGLYERATIREVRARGYRALYTSDRLPARPGTWFQPRYSVTAADTAVTVEGIIGHRSRAREIRNALASQVKRRR